jgi:hypothetical protein
MVFRLKCFKEDSAGGVWDRHIVFPFPPFPGMCVGSHVVKAVFVCQGDLDGLGDVSVQMEDVEQNEEAILKHHGWKYHN